MDESACFSNEACAVVAPARSNSCAAAAPAWPRSCALAPVFHVARIEQVFEGCVGFGGVGIVVSGLHLRGDELALNFAGRGVAQFKQPIDASFRLAVVIEQETHVMRALADKGFALASCNLLARDRLRHR